MDANYVIKRNGVTYKRLHDADTAEFLAERLWNREGGHVQVVRPSGRILSEFEE